MIRFLYGAQLDREPMLAASMFSDRAKQFRDRLNWPVLVDDQGHERDAYDDENPLYVIAEGPAGQHMGSMRFLPTTGPTMLNEVFPDVAGGQIVSPLIWECTRFCLSPDGVREGTISTSLMLAAAELGQRFHLAHAAAVFDRPMIRIYRTLGWAPEVLGDAEYGEARICVGLWDFASAPLAQLRDRAGVSEKTTDRWFREAFRTGRTSA